MISSPTNPSRSIYNLEAESRENALFGRLEDKIPVNINSILANVSIMGKANFNRNI